MYNEIIRDIIYFIFPNKSLVKDATQWDYESGADPLGWPQFPNDNPSESPFYNIGETNAVKAIDVALRELTGKSRKLKLAACKRQPVNYTELNFGHVPIEIAPNDFVFWARKSIWNPQEAALLSLGFCPSEEVVSAFDGVDAEGYRTCRLLRELSERIELIVSANRSGQLGGDGDPVDLIQWCSRMEFGLPEGLADTVLRIQSVAEQEPPFTREAQYSDREKETLLKLVAAMAIRGYSFDLTSPRNTATKELQDDLDFLGISLDQKTILKWVREAAKLLPDDLES